MNLEGIDLNNGQVLWKRELNGEYGWNDVFYTNDSTLVVAAAGLHSLDTKTGKGLGLQYNYREKGLYRNGRKKCSWCWSRTTHRYRIYIFRK